MRAGRPSTLAIAALFLLTSSASLFAEEIAWQKNLEHAVGEAQERDRLLLVRFSASWCTHCSRMAWRSLRDEQVAARIKDSFVPLELDADADEKALETFGVKLLPTMIVLTADQREIGRITGYRTAEELLGDFARIADPRPAGTAPGLIGQTIGTRPAEVPELAFGGYCLVSMFENETLVAGFSEHVAVHRGRKLTFASHEHKRRFEQDPQRYWPVLDGLCPVSAVDDRENREGSPELAIVYRNRLWLFADSEREEKFFLAAADYHRRLR